MSEETFWRTTPRKLFALITVHLDLVKAMHGGNGQETKTKGKNSKVPMQYIDQINW